jgi:hypothetical protein
VVREWDLGRDVVRVRVKVRVKVRVHEVEVGKVVDLGMAAGRIARWRKRRRSRVRGG